jgi:hypothetical protein
MAQRRDDPQWQADDQCDAYRGTGQYDGAGECREDLLGDRAPSEERPSEITPNRAGEKISVLQSPMLIDAKLLTQPAQILGRRTKLAEHDFGGVSRGQVHEREDDK